MASINLQGDTSGSISISAPSVAGSNTLTLPATSQTLATENALGVRNLIINGDMRIAQRGTSAVTASGSYPVDRFYVNNSSDAAFSAEQSTDVPSGQRFTSSLKVTYTTGDSSIGATQYSNIQHNIEGNNVAHLGFGSSGAKSVTLSFWVKASATGQYSYAIYNSAENRINPQPFTINSANTWEYKTITYDGDTTGTWLTNNGKGLTATLYTALGSDYLSSAGWNASSKYGVTGQANAMATTNNTFFITGVQLEVGDTATPFEHRPYDMELARCERYFQKNYLMEDAPGVSTSGENTRYMHGSSDGSNNGAAGVFWKCRMRATPTVTWYTDSGTQGQWNYARSGASGTGSFLSYRVGDTGANGYMGVGVAWASCSVWGNWTANAEL